MQFEIQGQDYFLHFDRDEGRWYVMRPTPHGIGRVPVINDDAYLGPVKYVIEPSQDETQVVN